MALFLVGFMGTRFFLVARLRPGRPLEIDLRAQIDRDVDHLPVDRNRGHPALQSLGEDLSHLHVIGGLLGTRAKALIACLDPRRVRTDRALEARVTRAPHGLLQLGFPDALARQAQWIAHPQRLPSDGGRHGDDLGFHVFEGLEFQRCVGRHTDIPGKLALVDRERADAGTGTGDLEGIPHAGGGAELDVDLERPGGDAAAFFEAVQAPAGLFDLCGLVCGLHEDARDARKDRRFELGCGGGGVDANENFGAASPRPADRRRHPAPQVFLPVAARRAGEIEDDRVSPRCVGFPGELGVFRRERQQRAPDVLRERLLVRVAHCENPSLTGATCSGVAHRQPVKPRSRPSLAAFAVLSFEATPPREPGRQKAPSGCFASIRAAITARVMRKRWSRNSSCGTGPSLIVRSTRPTPSAVTRGLAFASAAAFQKPFADSRISAISVVPGSTPRSRSSAATSSASSLTSPGSSGPGNTIPVMPRCTAARTSAHRVSRSMRTKTSAPSWATVRRSAARPARAESFDFGGTEYSRSSTATSGRDSRRRATASGLCAGTTIQERLAMISVLSRPIRAGCWPGGRAWHISPGLS